MNSNLPKVGDIVTIGKSKHYQLVVRSERVVSEDSLRSDTYWVDEIDVVPVRVELIGELKTATTMLRPAEAWIPVQTDPSPKTFHFAGGCMTGKGKPINHDDIKVVGTCKVKASVQYTTTKVKMYR